MIHPQRRGGGVEGRGAINGGGAENEGGGLNDDGVVLSIVGEP